MREGKNSRKGVERNLSNTLQVGLVRVFPKKKRAGPKNAPFIKDTCHLPGNALFLAGVATSTLQEKAE